MLPPFLSHFKIKQKQARGGNRKAKEEKKNHERKKEKEKKSNKERKEKRGNKDKRFSKLHDYSNSLKNRTRQ